MHGLTSDHVSIQHQHRLESNRGFFGWLLFFGCSVSMASIIGSSVKCRGPVIISSCGHFLWLVLSFRWCASRETLFSYANVRAESLGCYRLIFEYGVTSNLALTSFWDYKWHKWGLSIRFSRVKVFEKFLEKRVFLNFFSDTVRHTVHC